MSIDDLIKKEVNEIFKEVSSVVDKNYRFYEFTNSNFSEEKVFKEGNELFRANFLYEVIFDKLYDPKYIKEDQYRSLLRKGEKDEFWSGL